MGRIVDCSSSGCHFGCNFTGVDGRGSYPNQPVYQNGMRINRRGFKSSLLSTARGFGKRSDPSIAEPAEDPMPAGTGAYETIAYNPRLLAYLLRSEEGAGGDGHHRPEDY